jgi:hypothetical protein
VEYKRHQRRIGFLEVVASWIRPDIVKSLIQMVDAQGNFELGNQKDHDHHGSAVRPGAPSFAPKKCSKHPSLHCLSAFVPRGQPGGFGPAGLWPESHGGERYPSQTLSDTRAPSRSRAAPDVARAPAHRFRRAEDAGQGGTASGSPGRTRMLPRGGGSKIFEALITPRVYSRLGLTL